MAAWTVAQPACRSRCSQPSMDLARVLATATPMDLKACLISLLGCWGPDPATLWSRSREFCKAAVAVSVGQSEPESVRAHREVLLAGILHMYWCGRSEHTTRCHCQDMTISQWLEAPVVVS